MDAVVADVAHAAEHDALGKPVRALGISGAELTEHRHQRVAHHRVDLVDQQDQRRVGGPRPGLQERAERVVRTPGGVERVRGVGGGGIVKRVPGFPGDPRRDRPHRPPHILARGLRWFHVDVGAAVLAGLAAVEQAAQRQQSGRLSRLAGRVQHEVALVPDELEHFRQVEAVERRDMVVARGPDRTRSVEFPHGRERGRGVPRWQARRWGGGSAPRRVRVAEATRGGEVAGMRDFEETGQRFATPGDERRVAAGRRPADASGRRRLQDRLMAAFEAEPLEDGMDHSAEDVITAALESEDPDVVLRWIRSICLDSKRSPFAAGVLLCVARLPGVGTAGWREGLVRGGLAADNVEMRDAAMQAAEHWGDPGLRRTLSAHSEPLGWLDEYRRGVMEDLGA